MAPTQVVVAVANAQSTSCRTGWYLDQGSCYQCSPGRSMPPLRHSFSSCFACGPAQYSEWPYQLCLECPQGQYQPLRESSTCHDCPAGKTTASGGRPSRGDCLFDGSGEDRVGETDQGFGEYRSIIGGREYVIYYESASQADKARHEAGDALGDAVCDERIPEEVLFGYAYLQYGCVRYPECCGFVRCRCV